MPPGRVLPSGTVNIATESEANETATGVRLHALQEALGMTQEQLADAMGVSRVDVVKAIGGKSKMETVRWVDGVKRAVGGGATLDDANDYLRGRITLGTLMSARTRRSLDSGLLPETHVSIDAFRRAAQRRPGGKCVDKAVFAVRLLDIPEGYEPDDETADELLRDIGQALYYAEQELRRRAAEAAQKKAIAAARRESPMPFQAPTMPSKSEKSPLAESVAPTTMTRPTHGAKAAGQHQVAPSRRKIRP